MISNFDSNNLYLQPELVVCNPNLEQLQPVSFHKDLKLTLKFNDTSELSCTIYEKYLEEQTKEWVDNPCYEHITKNKVLYAVGIGYFSIYQSTENMNGGVNTKEVKAYSFEFKLNNKYVNFEDDTYEFYDVLDNSNTLLGKIIALCPAWSIGHVDSELWPLWRTFKDVDGSQTIYSFLMKDVEEAYGCIFKFDIENMTINAYTPNNSIGETDIVLSFDSNIKDIEIAEDTESIITDLYVAGSGDLTINNVNPLGNSYIINYDYYKQWMSQDLVDALITWEDKVESYQELYSNKLVELKDLNAELIALNGQLTDLNGELKAIDALRTAQMPDIQTSTTNNYNAKLVQIASKKTEITAKEAQIASKTAELAVINNDVKPENNFTHAQWIELDYYRHEASYINDNYEVTDFMTNVDIMELTQQLYNAAKEQMTIVSQPCYTFDMNSANFVLMKDFQQLISQVNVGSKIYVETERGWYNPLLLEMTIDYDKPDNLSMKFGNKFRLSDAKMSWNELMGTVKTTTSNVKGNSSLWTNGAKAGNLFTEYKNSILVAANQDIVNSEKQSFTIGEYGARSRKFLEDGSYDPEQLWINNGLICLTDNNWQTTKLAIGKVNGVYCVNAEVIAGNLLCGAELKIYTADGSFIVDENGAQLVNADFLMQTKEPSGRIKNQILLNPDTGFKIQTNTTSGTGTPVYKDIFYLASDGSGIRMEGSVATFGVDTSNTYDAATQLTSGGLFFYRKPKNNMWDLSITQNNSQLRTRMEMFGDSLVVNGKFSIMDGEIIRVYSITADNIKGNEVINMNGLTVDAATTIAVKSLFVDSGRFNTLTLGGQPVFRGSASFVTFVSGGSGTCTVSGMVGDQFASLSGTCQVSISQMTGSISYLS